MSLKLFRHTGYSSILAPGETRVALHPAAAITVVGLWIALTCNAALWREVAAWHFAGAGLLAALAGGLLAGSACAVLLSLLGWRNTLKPAATLVLVLAAISAWTNWRQGAVAGLDPLAALAATVPVSLQDFIAWSFPLTIALLVLPPAIWLWRTPLRRLAGPSQLRVNMAGAIAATLLGSIGFVLVH